MVQLKYFGDSRDFFKYDLITTLLQSGKFKNYVFIPMLTEHRDDNEGNIPPRYRGKTSKELLNFIRGRKNKTLQHWRYWLEDKKAKKVTYAAIEPVDCVYFTDKGRAEYWQRHESLLRTESALVFVDPDTGLETLRAKALEKYILNQELKLLINALSSTSVLMIYQHLQRNRHKHEESVKRKFEQILGVAKGVDENVWVCAYRENDLAFMFVCKDAALYKLIYKLLKKFYKNSVIEPKTLFPSVDSFEKR